MRRVKDGILLKQYLGCYNSLRKSYDFKPRSLMRLMKVTYGHKHGIVET